jgi:hypothetical protein
MPEVSLVRHRIKEADYQTEYFIALSEEFLFNPECFKVLKGRLSAG